jgi:RND family efflux transporter MFP subunit
MTHHPQLARFRFTGMSLFGGLALAVSSAVWGVHTRNEAGVTLSRATYDAAIPTVAGVPAPRGPTSEDIVLPGTVQAEYDTAVYARTSGYVKRWYTDLGAKVKAGQLLAEIDSPEVDQQLAEARAQLVQMQASLVQAQANAELAKVTSGRSTVLVHQGWASQQQGDQDRLTFAGSVAAVAVARANIEAQQAQVRRLEQLTGFERVVAPFDGVVTRRQVDVGNLIDAGSGTGPELFQVSDMSKLRIYVQVPQSYAGSIRPGLNVYLQFPEHPGRSFPATFVHTANAIDPQSRTLLVELQIDNSSSELLPGGYTDVHFKLPIAHPGVRVSANALLFRAEGLQIATCDRDGHITVHNVTLGRDFGTTVEVLTGIDQGDIVVLNPPSSLVSGDLVHLRPNGKSSSV